MDKVLIAIGAYLVYKSFMNETDEITENVTIAAKADGLLGMLLIFAILLSVAQYAGKTYTWIPASLAAIIALGFWSRK